MMRDTTRQYITRLSCVRLAEDNNGTTVKSEVIKKFIQPRLFWDYRKNVGNDYNDNPVVVVRFSISYLGYV